MSETIESRLKSMIVERLFLKVAPTDIDDEKSLVDEYGADSVSLLELVVGIEEEFGTPVEDEDFDVANFSTVARLAAFVRERVKV